MKIIKPGNAPPPPPKLFRGICHNCECEFECNQNEANWCKSTAPGLGVYRCGCPECGADTAVREVAEAA